MAELIKQKLERFLESGQFGKYIELCKKTAQTDEEKKQLYKIGGTSCSANINEHGFACYLNFIDESEQTFENVIASLGFDLFSRTSSYRALFAHLMIGIELICEDIEERYNYIIENTYDAEPIFPPEEIYEFVRTILAQWPNNSTALSTLKRLPQEVIDNPTTYAEKAAQMIAHDKRAAFKEFVFLGRFLETRALFSQLSDDEMCFDLFHLAYTTDSICTYDYTWFWMKEQGETAQKHLLLADLCWMLFKSAYTKTGFLNGTQQLHFFHTYRAAQLEPNNLEIQEKLLNLYEPGNESFDIEETKALVERILKVNPESEQGLRVLNLIG
jgi:hypothetical protein